MVSVLSLIFGIWKFSSANLRENKTCIFLTIFVTSMKSVSQANSKKLKFFCNFDISCRAFRPDMNTTDLYECGVELNLLHYQ